MYFLWWFTLAGLISLSTYDEYKRPSRLSCLQQSRPFAPREQNGPQSLIPLLPLPKLPLAGTDVPAYQKTVETRFLFYFFVSFGAYCRRHCAYHETVRYPSREVVYRFSCEGAVP